LFDELFDGLYMTSLDMRSWFATLGL